MVDTCVSGAYGEIHAGSSPAFGIYLNWYKGLQSTSITFQDSLDAFFIGDNAELLLV